MSYRQNNDHGFPNKDLPSAIESEKMLIAIAMLDPQVIPAMRRSIFPHEFYDELMSRAFAAVCKVFENIGSVDATSLFEELSKDRDFDKEMYGVSYFLELAKLAVSPVGFELFATHVRDTAVRRATIKLCGELAFEAYDRTTDTSALISKHVEQVSTLASNADFPTTRNRKPVLVCMADVVARKTQWLWFERLPQSSLSVLAGRPGEGKSMLTIEIAATVSTGRNWPDGTPCIQGSVILLAGEDHPEETIRPRLDAHGADPSKVHLLTGSMRLNAKGEECEVPVTLADVELIVETLDKLPDCRIIIIDPIGSFIGGGVDTDKDNKVRAVLAPLTKVAQQRGIAILLVAHTRKGSASFADDMVMGSRAFTGIARSVLHLMVHPDDKERRVLLPGKCNLGKPAAGLGFSITGDPARIEWEPEPVILNADEVLGSQGGGENRSRTELDEVCDWLAQLLESKGLPQREVEAAARSEGFSVATLTRAKQALNIKPAKSGQKGPWLWCLPPGSEDAQDAEPEAEGAHALGFEHLPTKQAKNTSNHSKMLNGTRMSIFGGLERLRNFGLDDDWGATP